MTTKNPTGYCPHCKQNVLLVREDINILLAIILLCFTCGIGLIIYLIIYYSQKEDRCIHCNTQITSLPDQYSQTILPNQTQYREVETISGETANYCPLCGEKLDNQTQNFCPHCGSKI